MALIHEVQVEYTHRSARVKSLDLHPTNPWILASTHSGTVSILNYQSKVVLNSLDIAQTPVRSAKFIARKQWIITGSDDMFIRVYDENTLEKVKEFEAHKDYIRSIIVHPTLPYVLSASDDHQIKLWDWENDWLCLQTFESHTHYVMQVAFNPKDPMSFSSASLDGTIKIWNLENRDPIATLEAHSKGLNCVGYFLSGDRMCLLSGSDDYTTKVWDYESKTCITTLEGHTSNVVAVSVHPEFSIIVTGSEDGTIGIWDAVTFRLDSTLDHGLGRVWAVEFVKGSSQIVIGYDEGLFLGKMIVKSGVQGY
ncbi:hypothetical protein Dimus_027786 [Dionaea muscipula]